MSRVHGITYRRKELQALPDLFCPLSRRLVVEFLGIQKEPRQRATSDQIHGKPLPVTFTSTVDDANDPWVVYVTEYLGFALESEPFLRTRQGVLAEHFQRNQATRGFLLCLKHCALTTSMNLVQKCIAGNRPIRLDTGAVGPLKVDLSARDDFDLMTR
jgi:hypothetical protein